MTGQTLARPPRHPPRTTDSDRRDARDAGGLHPRFAPRSYRKWSTGVVAVSGSRRRLSGRLRDRCEHRHLVRNHERAVGIAIFAVVIFVTGLPLAYYAARYNIDLDLITRGSGFEYYGRS